MSPRGASDLEGLARDLASGEISRRTALRRLAGVSLAAVLPPAFFADRAQAACPPNRRCGEDCCSKKERCRKGKCKCKKGLKKCRDKCVNPKTSKRHCGACGNRCATGETCVEGRCTAPDLPEEQPPAAVCGNGVIEGDEVCDGGNLGGKTCAGVGFAGGTLACAADCKTFDTSGCIGTCTPSCAGRSCGDDGCGGSCGSCAPDETCVGGQCQPPAAAVCGNGVIEGDEACDGDDLGAETCQTLGFAGGTLGCTPSCAFDTSGCFMAECAPAQTRPCYTGPPGTEGVGICRAGTQTCTNSGIWGPCLDEVTPQTEVCNGLDDDCDGTVDEGCP